VLSLVKTDRSDRRSKYSMVVEPSEIHVSEDDAESAHTSGHRAIAARTCERRVPGPAAPLRVRGAESS
jgi:hypothetical protein